MCGACMPASRAWIYAIEAETETVLPGRGWRIGGGSGGWVAACEWVVVVVAVCLCVCGREGTCTQTGKASTQ